MAVQEGDRATWVLAWGLTAASAGLSAWGWLNDGFTPLTAFFALVFVIFQLGANKMSEFARRLGGARPVSAGGCLVAMVGFGLFCHESLKLAWLDAEARGLVTSTTLTEALLLALPFAEPFCFWVKRQLTELENQAEPETPLARSFGPLAAGAVALSAAASTALPSPPAIERLSREPARPVKLDPVSRSKAEERAMAMLMDRDPGTGRCRHGQREIAEECGLTRYQVRVLWDAVKKADAA